MYSASLCRGSVGVALALVATQHKNVIYARQLEVNECILCILERVAVTKDVWHHGHIVTVMYGCSHCHRTGTAAYATQLESTVTQVLVYGLTVVGCYVYISRVKLHQTVDVTEQATGTSAFQRREYLEREGCP